MKTFSAIMPVTCQMYPGAASDRSQKFIDAVTSFISGSYPSDLCELIIISDGDKVAENIYNEKFSHIPNIVFKKIDKQPDFSGNVRQAGIELAKNDWIVYLDSDDEWGVNHLTKINKQLNVFKYIDWCYFNEYVGDVSRIKKVIFEHGSIGTSSLCHKRSLGMSWSGCDGYGHDFIFAKNLRKANRNYTKITMPEYIIKHIPELLDKKSINTT